MTMGVLVAIEEAALRARLARVLQSHGYVVTLARENGHEPASTRDLDAAIVAPASFDAEGLALARKLCAAGRRVIVLTNSREAVPMVSRVLPEADAVPAQSIDEQGLLRLLAQSGPAPEGERTAPTLLQFDGRMLDLGGRAFLDADGREVALTHAEFELLALLARNGGRVLTRDQIRNGISGRDHAPYDRSIDMLVGRLRRKIEPDAKSPRFILTKPGVGYKFAPRVRQALHAAAPPSAPVPEEAGKRSCPGERRQLSVLVCQIQGFAAVSAKLDAEDVGELTSTIQRVCADVAARFRGVVARLLGDSALIYFGYKEAEEHDAERAVRAGLALAGAVRAVDPSGALHAHIGIATGVMLVPPGPAKEFAAAGQALNLALRLQAAAPADGVLVVGPTRELVGDFFNYEEMEPLVLADDLAPVAVWRVTGERTNAGRFDALRRSGMVEFVGRAREMELLRRCWSQVLAGAGQVVLIAGEPGIGKSRLVAEFQEERSIGRYGALKYFGSPHQTDASLYPVIGELQRAAGFDRADTPSERLAKLAVALGEPGGSASQKVDLIADLLLLPAEGRPALELAPRERKERTLAALLVRIRDRAARQPLLLIVEDAHWLDPTSVEFFSQLVEAIPELPVMMIITARPEFTPPWPVYAHMTCVTLARLGREDAGLLAQRVVGRKPLPREATAQILSHTDGIPLFIEELTKTLLERGILREGRARYEMIGDYPSHAVPKTLHGLLSARLDRLGAAKEVAQIGAVIGREFSHDLLSAVCTLPDRKLKGALEELIASELVFRRGTDASAVYTFKHALVQDAAYATLLREPKRALHARIANVLETQFGEIAERQPELLAHHCTEAGLIEKAAGLWGKAGLQSLQRSALLEATAQLSRALAQIATLPGTPALRRQQIKFQVALANALMHTKGYASPDTKASFEQARSFIEGAEALGETPEDPLLLFAVIYGFWVGNYVAFNGTALCDLSAQFLALAESQAATVPLMIGHRLMGTSMQCTGEFAKSRAHYDRAIALYRPAEHRPLAVRFGQDVGVVVWSYRAWTLWLLGHPVAALADADAALKEAREIGQAATLMYALAHATRTYFWTGGYEVAGALAKELAALAEEKGASAWGAFGMMHHGSLLALSGAGEAATRMIASGLDAWKGTGSTLWIPCYLSSLAHARAKLGRYDDARRHIGEALATVETSKATWCEAEIHRIAGEIVLLSPGADTSDAQARFERALAIARKQEARAWELRAAMSLARLWRDRGKRRQARNLLAPVYDRFTEGLDTLDLTEARSLLGELRA